ncbi:MAG TPA: MAP7 domain-containing protein, partial [Solirubrobacterales bacterium]|nr:MAP7 domain-containing protein [Solirubrobacterales bacterium]
MRRLVVVGALTALLLALAAPPLADADPAVTLVRVYRGGTGMVFEVCRGPFDPPVTDAENPAYCKGKIGRWGEARWEAYNSAHGPGTGSVEGAGEGGEDGKGAGGEGNGKGASEPAVATGTEGPSEEATPVVPYGGSLDPTAVLGITNPLCGETGQLSAQQERNCRSSHSPEAAYPIGNYGWDIHVEAGGFISSLFVPAVSFVLEILSVIWLVLLMLLKGCLIILGFAFSLSPFTDNRMLGQISAGLTRFYDQLTSPWLTTLFVVLGAWGLYNGIVRRRTGETLGAMAMALAMMLGALWIIHSPRDTVGRLAGAIDSTSLIAVSAPSSGSVGAPIRSYNDAMAAVWNQMTAVPFCAMDFSSVGWCMNAEPSEAAIEAARSGLGEGDAFTQQLLASLPSAAPAAATATLSHDLSGLFGRAPTIRDLYLRFGPESGPRDKLWDYYNGEPDEHVGLPLDIGPQIDIGGGSEGHAPDKVSMQGRGGVLTRMVMVFVFAVGLTGGLLLLLWLAMKLVIATAAAFVLVLAAPLAMFFPVFGQTGRAIFTRWATSLLGSAVAKLIYSGLLGIVLLGSTILGTAIGGSSPTLGLVAVMAFWWAVFLSRDRYLAVFQIDPVAEHDTGPYRMLAGGYLGYRVAKAASGAVGNLRSEHRESSRHRSERETRRRQEGAERSLERQAHERLDVATQSAGERQTAREHSEREARSLREDGEVRALRDDPGSLSEEARESATAKQERLGEIERRLEATSTQARADR